MSGSRSASKALAFAALFLAAPAAAQIPLAPVRGSGQTVTPAFEGWYVNPDGTRSISFGYFNRNTEEAIEIPLGPDNRIEPEEFDGLQPTRFEPRRHWGVFAVRVPASFPEDEKVVWTLRIRGETFTIPGRLHEDWRIDALEGEAGAGNTPPVLAFAEDGPRGAGPLGLVGPDLRGRVGEAVPLTVWAWDDGRPSGSVATGGRSNVPVTLTWFKHQGPGDVAFSEESQRVPVEGGQATVTATFSAPGDYILRVRANDASGVAGAGHAQCCWTNGFVHVSVSR